MEDLLFDENVQRLINMLQMVILQIVSDRISYGSFLDGI
jgi:hypothetical protein